MKTVIMVAIFIFAAFVVVSTLGLAIYSFTLPFTAYKEIKNGQIIDAMISITMFLIAWSALILTFAFIKVMK